ncbi:MAG: cupin domain-containing protein [Halofilum sp. (in: g-proteobacteria)]
MKDRRIVHNDATPEYYFEERCHITEWWNTAADEAVSIARARVEPGVTTRLHRLRGVTERYVILEGAGRVTVADGAPETVGPGAVVVIPPDASQRIANTGATDLVFLAICTPRFRPEIYEDAEDGDCAD